MKRAMTSRRAALITVVGALLALALLLAGSPAAASARGTDTLPAAPGLPASGLDLTPGTTWYAGGATESIAPTQAMIDTHEFYLGGFGFGSGKTLINDYISAFPQYTSGRAATSVMPGAYGPSVRAMAIGDGKHAMVTAQIETQGYFLAYKNGDYGIVDIRRQAAADIAALAAAHPGVNALPARSIVVDSNHTHGGPDTAGVWGGVPTEPKYHGDMDYLKLVKDRTVKAIVDAWKALQPVELYYADAPAGIAGPSYDDRYPAGFDKLMHNQYDDDPANQAVDDQVRVLQARDLLSQKPVVTYVNFSAHADVLGGGNLAVTGDYTGPLSELLAKDGGVGFAQVATLGREQPERGDCSAAQKVSVAEPDDQCKLRLYAERVAKRAEEALATAKPVSGQKVVAMSSYFLTDAASNALILGLDYGGFAAGLPLLRAETPPWETGNVMGTTMFSGRIGNLVISGNPGEPYPQILDAVRHGAPGKQGYFSLGTAGDFLGYIIYPFQAYPEPIRRSILDGGPPPNGSGCGPAGCPNPIGNDNFFFNVSESLGQRLVCAELRGTADNFPADRIDPSTVDPQCKAFSGDAALPAGWETQFSSTGAGPTNAPPSDVPEAPYTVLLLLAGLGVGGLAVVRRRRTA
jgi:MYXO-CTERM domain-containing protein